MTSTTRPGFLRPRERVSPPLTREQLEERLGYDPPKAPAPVIFSGIPGSDRSNTHELWDEHSDFMYELVRHDVLEARPGDFRVSCLQVPEWAHGAALLACTACAKGFAIPGGDLTALYNFELDGCGHERGDFRFSAHTTIHCPICSWEVRNVRTLRQAYRYAAVHLESMKVED